MDIDGAIQAHTDWKVRLLNLAHGTTTEKIDLQTLGTDNLCVLGRWLHGDGQKHRDDAKFAKLVETHAAFHKCAATIGTLIAEGNAGAAENQLTSVGSEFNRLSFRVTAFLKDMDSRHLA